MFRVSVEQLMQYNDNANSILKLKMCFPQRPKIPLGVDWMACPLEFKRLPI